MLFNSLDKQSHGPSYWKFNSSLLEDSSYVEFISLKYSEWLDEFKEVTDKRVLWDLVKYRVRSCTMKYSKGKARERRARLAEAEKNGKRYLLICDNDPSQNNVNDLEVAKQEYALLRDYIVRSRINWYENGEKNSKYFLNLEKARRGKTAVRRLYDSTGKITVNPRSIINELGDYYQTLYSNHESEEGEEFASDFLENPNIPSLSSNSTMTCEGLLMCTECFEALKKFPNGKTPGNEGLMAEFYKTFCYLLGQQLTDFLNYSFEQGELSTSQKQAIVKLIDKKDKDRRYIKNWRPISLLNVDMKIASKALT